MKPECLPFIQASIYRQSFPWMLGMNWVERKPCPHGTSTSIPLKCSRAQVETQTRGALASRCIHSLWIVPECLSDLHFCLRPQNSCTDSHPGKLTLSSDKPRAERTRTRVFGTAKPVIVWGHRSSLPSQGGPWAIANPGPRCVRKRFMGEVSVF